MSNMVYEVLGINEEYEDSIVYCEEAVDSNDGVTILKFYSKGERNWEKFNVSEYKKAQDSREIKNDSNLYISDMGVIYQVFVGNLTDSLGQSIPHAYRVRIIGYTLELKEEE